MYNQKICTFGLMWNEPNATRRSHKIHIFLIGHLKIHHTETDLHQQNLIAIIRKTSKMNSFFL